MFNDKPRILYFFIKHIYSNLYLSFQEEGRSINYATEGASSAGRFKRVEIEHVASAGGLLPDHN